MTGTGRTFKKGDWCPQEFFGPDDFHYGIDVSAYVEECLADKLRWMAEYRRRLNQRNIVIRILIRLFSMPDRMLEDKCPIQPGS